MIEFDDNCWAVRRDKVILVQERGKQFLFDNSNARAVELTKVDGCKIKEGIRCDFMARFETGTQPFEYFIELKGQNITHALEQLLFTWLKLGFRGKHINTQAFIVLSRSKNSATKNRKIKKEWRDKYKIELIITNRRHTESIP